MSLLGKLLGNLNLSDVFAKYLISGAKLEEMRHTKVNGEVELPAIKTRLPGGGYWVIPLGPAKRIE